MSISQATVAALSLMYTDVRTVRELADHSDTQLGNMCKQFKDK